MQLLRFRLCATEDKGLTTLQTTTTGKHRACGQGERPKMAVGRNCPRDAGVGWMWELVPPVQFLFYIQNSISTGNNIFSPSYIDIQSLLW